MPIYAHYVNGLPGGIDNPLGARALYLYRGNQDTYFRLHGTNEPDTIGTKASSGCIRLFNQDIIDLYTAFRSARRSSSCRKASAAQRQRRRRWYEGGWLRSGWLWTGWLCGGWLWTGRLRSGRRWTGRL